MASAETTWWFSGLLNYFSYNWVVRAPCISWAWVSSQIHVLRIFSPILWLALPLAWCYPLRNKTLWYQWSSVSLLLCVLSLSYKQEDFASRRVPKVDSLWPRSLIVFSFTLGYTIRLEKEHQLLFSCCLMSSLESLPRLLSSWALGTRTVRENELPVASETVSQLVALFFPSKYF